MRMWYLADFLFSALCSTLFIVLKTFFPFYIIICGREAIFILSSKARVFDYKLYSCGVFELRPQAPKKYWEKKQYLHICLCYSWIGLIHLFYENLLKTIPICSLCVRSTHTYTRTHLCEWEHSVEAAHYEATFNCCQQQLNKLS